METPKRYLQCDFETYSEIDIKSCGSFRYIDDPSFEPLLLAYAYGDDEPTLVDFTKGETIPESVVTDLDNPNVIKTAFNVAFERTILQKMFPNLTLDPEQWLDTKVIAAACSLPLSLQGVSDALGLPKDLAKMKEGKQLIQYFCKPCRPTKTNGRRTRNLPEHAPDKWATFCEYNKQDVVAERAVRKMLERWTPDETEHRFWCLDAKINERGVRIDRRLAANAVMLDERYKAELTERAVEISGLDNPKSVSQIKDWLAEQEGLEVPSLNKKVIADVVSQLQSDKAKEFLALRSELSKSSTAKYKTMLRCLCSDGHVKGCFEFGGASRTGRFAGRLLQLQNLAQNHLSDLDACRNLVLGGYYDDLVCLYGGVSQPLSELIRTALIPEAGHKWLVADFSAIEARVIAWLAGEQWVLDVFRDGGDIYCATASQMFKVPVVKHGANRHLRQKGKVATLACIAEGQLVITNHGEKPIETVAIDDLVWDGEQWVRHEGLVYRGEREVITYDGLTATADHLVWVEGHERPIHFGVAASSGARLLQSSPDRPLLRERRNNQCRTKVRVYDLRNAGRHHRFTVSGVLVHNCGYGGGVNALKAFGADKMGMSDEEMQETVDLWRDSNPHIVAMWKSLERAAIKCVVRRTPQTDELTKTRFDMEKGILWMTLPSGRRIAYFGAQYGESQWNKGRKVLSYMGVDQQRKRWTRLETWGGKIAENITQGIARDCLREAMMALDEHGYDIRAHVHDEVIVTEPIGGRCVEEMAKIMGQPISWAPGLLLRADGYECDFYMKA